MAELTRPRNASTSATIANSGGGQAGVDQEYHQRKRLAVQLKTLQGKSVSASNVSMQAGMTSAMRNQIEGAGARAMVAVLEVIGGFLFLISPQLGDRARIFDKAFRAGVGRGLEHWLGIDLIVVQQVPFTSIKCCLAFFVRICGGVAHFIERAVP